MVMDRRQFLGAGLVGATLAGATACQTTRRGSGAWDQGTIKHVIPAASPSRFIVKMSFVRPVRAPELAVDGNRVAGVASGTSGRFWSFDAEGLAPNTVYTLQPFEAGQPLSDPWPLKTFPEPGASPERVRMLVYTCAGGYEGTPGPGGRKVFRPLSLRHKLLDRAMGFQPDVVVAIGDHIYWDQRSWLDFPVQGVRENARKLYDEFGYFDRSLGFDAGANEDLLIRLADPQIADLYGARFRSTPAFFLCDDHDYYENDEARPEMVTLPPEEFLVSAQRATGRKYYPPFFADASMPADLPGLDAGKGLSETFGTLRYGDLLEAQLFDCARYLDFKNRSGGLVPAEVESWLIERTRASELRHLVQIPSTPMGWSAGKWREWYPDVSVEDGDSRSLSLEGEKYLWPRGWWEQHQRLVKALSEQTERAAITLSGDLHAVGYGQIRKSADLDLSANPLHSILSGPISTDDLLWPSAARGVGPSIPTELAVEQEGPPREHNGFTILDVTRDDISVRQFAWREPMAEDEIASMPPVAEFDIKRI